MTLQSLIDAIQPLDRGNMEKAAQHIDSLVKPPGSLGRLEALAIQLSGMPGIVGLQNLQKEIIVMCADHGVYDEGVAISPKNVTAIQARNMLKGLTGVCVLAKNSGTHVLPVDIGIDCDPIEHMLSLKIARGCGNIAKGAAMDYGHAEMLLLTSAQLVQQRIAAGITVFGIGELGIANTTAAAAVISVLTGNDPCDVVGLGANFPSERLAYKQSIVRQAIAINQPDHNNAIDVLAKVGGFELVGMAGVILGAAASGVPVILDGFLSYASALAACQLSPIAREYCIPSHLSAEKGAALALRYLNLQPYLHLDLRLGEGSGAAMAMSLIDAACSMYCHMGKLASSGINLPALEKPHVIAPSLNI
ncbi:nicotinate-nucleotide--dimethylbenzimidazole phosphoribosyltransferase [Xenorhabdus griffiniae]|uniref:Nicotinate-nucleotide--dimethylbenzimidazole phosphoribosyltransferase n=1 Tax=Xenorhabdus griffiniae TaxID=351672 RepID=A0ABY9XKC4_9GAMM|nr:nicotinate-nucleotide--dimethylbenzimidazole phosphoribosyltransferase [Xenorhabdus griffiniae]MBD1228056.1 nicotinate-nucleotide--dimethylbenzimidazole phosphoribosyltransferase [Xenorhabdus griffiniae]MBE8588133.1 nicotinate-nucleotide--dimethylbenzimidazole phosphoribosyltransferase [Xenorhabdus griffiniae]WMV73376.1 nicotinate-nucleotide--dimethylbenzimidazole phosphoribosyltransferase [Xenorhabdus griffiniae]WNH03055.1 nicotinate-nucleotide--dimethylbenzimidazole phosphoribosyltransfera